MEFAEAEIEQRRYLAFSREKPNLPRKDLLRPETDGDLYWEKVIKWNKLDIICV
jgi:hypothetical protein